MAVKTKQPNILLVANYPADVGYAWWLMENFWVSIGEYFNGAGIESILAYPEINALPKEIENSSVKVCSSEISMSKTRQFLNICKIIKKYKIGYIYLTDKPYYGISYAVFRILGVKRIVNHDHLPGERDSVSLFKKLIKKTIHKTKIFSCDFYIGVSEFVKRRAIEIACLPSEKCQYVHNGIHVFDSHKTSYSNDKFKIPVGSKIVVSTGRATFYKGLDLLIQVAKVIIKTNRFPDLYFLHIGDGPDLEKFKAMAREAGIQDRFIFAGFRKDVVKILPSCDIGIQLSHGEAFSLSIIEYLCAGLATMAPRHCGNAEAIDDGRNGILFTPGDVEEIVAKMIFLLENPHQAASLGRAGRTTVVDKFSIDRCNEKLIALLKDQFV